MALQKQKVQLSINDGIDTKSDAPNVLATKFTEVENVVYSKLGGARKRAGNYLVPNDKLGGGTVDSGLHIERVGNQTVVVNSDSVNTYNEVSQTWSSTAYNRFNLTADDTLISTGDCIYRSRYTTSGYYEGYLSQERLKSNLPGPLTIRHVLQIRDTISGTVVLSKEVLNNTSSPYFSICGNSNGFLIITVNSATFFSVSTLTESAPVVNANFVNNRIISDGTDFYVLEGKSTGTRITKFSQALVELSTNTITAMKTTTVVAAHLENSNQHIRISTTGTGAPDYPQTCRVLASDVATIVQSPTTITTSFGQAETVTSCINDTGLNNSVIYLQYRYAYNGTYKTDTYIYRANADNTITTITALNNCAIDSGAAYYNGKPYIVVANWKEYATARYPDVQRRSLDCTSVLVSPDSSGVYKPVAVISKEVSRPINLFSYCDRFSDIVVSGPTLRVPANYISQIDNLSGIMTDYFSVSFKRIVLTSTTSVTAVGQASDMLLDGALPVIFNNNTILESGFLIRPQMIDVEPFTGFSPIWPIGTYGFVLVFRRVDSSGREYRSAPSDVQYATIAASVTAFRLYHNYNLIPYTFLDKVVVEVYIQFPGGTTFYKQADEFSLPHSTDYFNVNNYDASVSFGELLYTTGGGLQYDALPPSKHLSMHKSRIFSVNATGKVINYSQIMQPGYPMLFSDYLYKDLIDNQDTIMATESMDSNLIIFTDKSIKYLAGDGPNNLGQQDDFGNPVNISADVGLKDAKSIVSTPLGLMFNSTKGIYLLSRSLQVSYIGAPVEAYNGTVVDAVMVPNTNEVRFFTENNDTLVYDYLTSRWAVYPGQGIVSACVSATGQLNMLQANGYVLREWLEFTLDDAYTDNGTYVPMKLTTAWISLAGLQGYQRLYKFMLLGTYKTPHRLKVSFAYDMSETYTSSIIIDSETRADLNSYNLEFRPDRQKCSMVKIKIEELQPLTLPPGTNFGQGLTISGLAMEIGVKEGLNKVINNYGAS